MRFLLAGILGLLPLNTQAASYDSAHIGEPNSSAVTDPSDTRHPVEPPSLDDEVGLRVNPYSPLSPTNFEALGGPYLYVQGREGTILYDPNLPNPTKVNDAAAVSSTESLSRIPLTTTGPHKDMYGRDIPNKVF